MPLVVFTDGHSPGVGTETLFGSWEGPCHMGGICCEDVDCFLTFRWGYPGEGLTETDHQIEQFDCVPSGSFSQGISIALDRVFQFRARGVNDNCAGSPANGELQTTKSFAASPTAGTPAVSAITSNSATVDCTFNANVVESTFAVFIQYRQLGTTTWLNAGTAVSSGTSISRGLTGLLGSTTYQVRLLGNRDTENEQSWESVTVAFTTLANAPTITTNAASGVATTSAVLNGTVDPNNIAVRVRFGWDTSDEGSDPLNWSNLTTYQSFSGDGDQGFQQAISGLLATTTYFFRAFVEWPSPGFANGASGVTLSFTTPANPLAQAVEEDHMHIYEYWGRYGVQHTFYFTLSSPAATSSDRLVTTAPGSLFVAGDIKLSKDGAAFANVTNAVVQIAASNPLYSLTLTATEMQTTQGVIQIVDQNGPAFRDAFIIVRTKVQVGQIDVQGDQIGSSASALLLRPSSGGFAINCVESGGSNIGTIVGFLSSMALRTGQLQAGGAGTATLDSGASATNDYYNGDILMLVGGTGAGQSRIIDDYVGATKVATLNSGWTLNPDSTTRFVIVAGARIFDVLIPELTTIPAAGASAREKLQFCFQRFAFKVTQTATLQTLFNSSGASLGTRSVSDDGTTQTIEKVV